MFNTSAVKQGLLVGFVAVVIAAGCSNSDGGRGEPPVSSDLSVADSSAPDEATSTTDEATTTVVEEVTTTTGEATTVEVHDDDASVSVVEDGEAAETTTTVDLDNQTTTTAAAPSTTASPTTTAVAAPTTSAPETTDAPTPTAAAPSTTEPAEEQRVDGGSVADLVRYDDECRGTLMGRYQTGHPTGCVLDNGAVLCLAATHSPGGELLYNAAEWQLCPDFDPNREPCSTSLDATEHGYIDRWEYVIKSADFEPYLRPLLEIEETFDLMPGLWFSELCVRNNEGSQIGTPGPQVAGVFVQPVSYCAGLASFNTSTDGPPR